MAGLCKVMIIGNLGKDPELRYTTAGKPVATFNVAVNRPATSVDGERREENRMVSGRHLQQARRAVRPAPLQGAARLCRGEAADPHLARTGRAPSQSA
ncbi:MAG: hypothetical protein KatS3mg060_3209 [Dehalococcoidia bacterium]|nr:MAG: hypothetical protein KatS3mg060_3209 [Dehalococcoidia bacterium]